MNEFKSIPNDIEAEKSVLSAMFQDNQTIRIAGKYGDNIFYDDNHRAIFKAMVELYTRGEPVDVITLSNELKEQKKLDGIGGTYYLTELFNFTPSATNIEYHLDILKEFQQKRQLQNLSSYINQALEGDPIPNVLATVRGNLENIERITAGISRKSHQEYLSDYYKSLGDGTKQLRGIETHIPKLDKLTRGLSGVVILGGTPGRGKSTFCLQIAFDACEKDKIPVLFYSLEMPRTAIYTKILNRLSGVDFYDILLRGRPYLDPEYNGDDLPRERSIKSKPDKLKEASKRLEAVINRFNVRTYERGEPEINFIAVESEIEAMKSIFESDKLLVVIDALQNFPVNIKDYRDQLDKENLMIRQFQNITERTGATIILVSHKNKKGLQEAGMHTIKGSVDIVYIADIVMSLEIEGKESESDILTQLNIDELKKLYLDISKQRYNPPGKVKLEYDGKYSTFIEPPEPGEGF